MDTMIFPRISRILPVLLAFILASGIAHAQRRAPRRNDTTRRELPRRIDSTRTAQPPAPIDTASRAAAPLGDTLRADTLAPDSLAVSTGGSGIDTVVVYSARDSTVFDVRHRIMRLYGDASVTKGAQKLTAAYIEIDFTKSELYAEARYDSATHKFYGVPVFRDAEQELSANTLRYNFATKKGTLGAAETKLADGFYYGDKIKRVSENTLFVRNGVYTTCDAPHPHYYFSSPEMKVVTGDRVFADQLELSVADVPIFYLPVGVFFPSNSGRHSGLIIPRPSQSSAFGFTLEGLGYFWAASDYFDTQIYADLYSKGGFTLRDNSRIEVRDAFIHSTVNLTYGYRRDNVDLPFVKSYIVEIGHQQKLSRTANLSGNINFTSHNALRNTTTRINPYGADYTTQVASSSLSFSESWKWGGALSASYERFQNIITGQLTQRLPLSFTLPTYTPFANSTGEGNLFSNLSLGLVTRGGIEFFRQDTIAPTISRGAVTVNPSISLTPKLGVVTVQPYINTSATFFPRRIVKQAVGDTVVSTDIPGWRGAYSFNAGVNLSTKLYGIIQPNILGLTAIRHTLVPTVGFRYSPDFSKPGGGPFSYRDQVFDPRTNRVVSYSIFEKDESFGFGSAPGNELEKAVAIGLSNIFDAKIAQGDTLPDRKIQLLQLDLSTSYNAAAKEFRWGQITSYANVNLGSVGNLSGNATFSLYDVDTAGITIPVLLIDRGRWPVRATNARIQFSTSISDQGFATGVSQNAVADSAEARRERFNFEATQFNDREFFGESVRGNAAFRIPWQLSFAGSYDLSRKRDNSFDKQFNINVGFSFTLTPTTVVSSSGSYNLNDGKIYVPQITLRKDLHCWQMSLQWQPTGHGRGFYFSIGLKAPQLQDIKYEKIDRANY